MVIERVFVILILCFFTSPPQGPSPLLSLLLLLQSGRLGAIPESENKGALRGENSQEIEGEKWKKEQKGRRRGHCFPSTAIHDLILFHSTETFPGMRICFKKWETQWDKKRNSKKEMMESGVRRRWRRSREKEEFGTIYMEHVGSFQKVVVNLRCLLQLLEGLIITPIGINNIVLAESKQETGSFLHFCWCQWFSCKYPKLALYCLSQYILTPPACCWLDAFTNIWCHVV